MSLNRYGGSWAGWVSPRRTGARVHIRWGFGITGRGFESSYAGVEPRCVDQRVGRAGRSWPNGAFYALVAGRRDEIDAAPSQRRRRWTRLVPWSTGPTNRACSS